MDRKGPINPPSKQYSYIHVIVDAFSHFVVTVPVKQNNAQNAVNSQLHHWITKFGPPVYLVTDCGSEYIILNLQIFVPQWESGIHKEFLMHHGQMV